MGDCRYFAGADIIRPWFAYKITIEHIRNAFFAFAINFVLKFRADNIRPYT